MNFYEEKLARKKEAFDRLAAKNALEAKNRNDHANKLADAIPFGQPILVGHHSERMHRNHIAKIHSNMDKAIEANEKADYYAHKADLAENPVGISSDDPEAIQKLKVKLAAMENERKEIKAREHRGWELSNLSANMRRVKQRIEYLEKMEKVKAAIPDKNEVINGIEIFIDKEENRVKMIFPGKPAPEVIQKLKQNGFHWSPYNKAWQRMISEWAIQLAHDIANA